MADIEGEWCDAAMSALPMTAGGCKILWQVFIEVRNGAETWADFKPDENQRIDTAFLTDKRPVTLGEPPNSWTVDV